MVSTVHSDVQAHRVLVVDDDADTVEALTTMFALLGHQSEGVLSGREALRVARSFDPTLVALDICLGDVDGYQVARALRADPKTRRGYLVALTGRYDTNGLSSSSGFDRHIVKPIELARIRQILRDADGRRSAA